MYGPDPEAMAGDFGVKSGVGTVQRNESSPYSSLVLDSERGELVQAFVSAKRRKMACADRSVDALRNHSEAEKQRRARINAHLDTLRRLVPGATKMDKASLLAEVVNHLRQLKRNALAASENCIMPTDVDEVKVEQQEDESGSEPKAIKASLCCDYRPGLLSGLRQALDKLQSTVLRAEIATVGGRMKSILLMTRYNENNIMCNFPLNSVRVALCSLVDEFSISLKSSQRPTFSSKRRRISLPSSVSPSG